MTIIFIGIIYSSKIIYRIQVSTQKKSAGRKTVKLWDDFRRVPNSNRTGFRALCKHCQKEIQGVLDRMRNHLEICQQNVNILLSDSDENKSNPIDSHLPSTSRFNATN